VIVNDELVTKITNEILRRLNSPGLKAADGKPAKKPLLTVGPLESLSVPVQTALKERYEICSVDTWESSDLPSAPLLMTTLGLQALCRVASGDEGCTIEGRVLLSALLEGRTAVLLNTGLVWRRFKDTAPKVLEANYLSYESTLRSAGLKIVSNDEILTALEGPLAPAWSPSLSPLYQAICPAAQTKTARAVRGRVLTENCVQELFPKGSGPGEFKLNCGDILTPLAKDYLLAQKITVTK
jgi:ethanolamine utilization protein